MKTFTKKSIKDMTFLLFILIFALLSYLVFKVNEGLQTCNCKGNCKCNCKTCKTRKTHWGWPTFF